MNETELLLAVADDRIAECQDKYIYTNTNFLDVYQQSAVRAYLNKKGVNFDFYGGFDGSERRLAVFMPDYIEDVGYFNENPEASPLSLLRIEKDGFSSLSHRDYLGALMGLGIKREMIGDIVTDDKGCFAAVMQNVAVYIAENLTSVGRGSVKVLPEKDFSAVKLNENFELIRCSSPSMRLDAVTSSAFNLSRSAACEKIRRGEVFLNGIQTLKNDAHVSFGSKLTLRGSGKVIIDEDAGVTKKGRQAYIIKKYK